MASDVEEGKGPGLSPADAGKQAGGKRRSTTFPSRALNVLTAACTLLCMVAFGLAIALGPHARDLQGFCQQALRVYGIALGLFILLTETEWERFLSAARVLDSWTFRGALYSFEALLTAEITSTVVAGSTDYHRSLQLYRLPAAGSLLACAALYFLGGVLCIGSRKRATKQRELERTRVQESLLDLDRKREELHGLLQKIT